MTLTIIFLDHPTKFITNRVLNPEPTHPCVPLGSVGGRSPGGRWSWMQSASGTLQAGPSATWKKKNEKFYPTSTGLYCSLSFVLDIEWNKISIFRLTSRHKSSCDTVIECQIFANLVRKYLQDSQKNSQEVVQLKMWRVSLHCKVYEQHGLNWSAFICTRAAPGADQGVYEQSRFELRPKIPDTVKGHKISSPRDWSFALQLFRRCQYISRKFCKCPFSGKKYKYYSSKTTWFSGKHLRKYWGKRHQAHPPPPPTKLIPYAYE